MNNLKGYHIDHPELDSVSSEWFIFTHKNKLYQVSVSIDSFHNDFEYDIRVFSYSKYRPNDDSQLNRIYTLLHNKGIQNTLGYSKSSLKKIFGNLNSIIVRNEIIENVSLGPYLKSMLKDNIPKFNITKNIGDIYYELVLDRVK
tara:strand:- start:771 stop:1202 length:432 start_codon:yes stop_codon:yes gene_type:complete